MSSLGGLSLYNLGFGDEIIYFTPFTISLFIIALIFTIFVVISKPGRQIVISSGKDASVTKDFSDSELRFHRFLAIGCGLASIGAAVTGDLFNFSLFCALVGIINVGTFAIIKEQHVKDASFQYGLVVFAATLPLFAGAAVALAVSGSLSILELSKSVLTPVPVIAKLLLLLGVAGEGMAPFYAAKTDLFRSGGSSYLLICSLSSFLIFIRAIEIILVI